MKARVKIWGAQSRPSCIRKLGRERQLGLFEDGDQYGYKTGLAFGDNKSTSFEVRWIMEVRKGEARAATDTSGLSRTKSELAWGSLKRVTPSLAEIDITRLLSPVASSIGESYLSSAPTRPSRPPYRFNRPDSLPERSIIWDPTEAHTDTDNRELKPSIGSSTRT